MRLTYLLAISMVVSTVSAADPGDPKRLEIPAETLQRAVKLVLDFDDPDFRVRNDASAEIEKMGRQAYPALYVASRFGPSKLAKARVAEALLAAVPLESEARAEEFLADKEGKYPHHLLGWTKLVAAAGDTPETRKMFTAVLKDAECRELLLEAAKPPTLADENDSAKCRHRLCLKWQAHLDVIYAAKQVVNAQPRPRGRADVPITWLCAALVADLEHPASYRNHLLVTVGDFLLTTDEGQDAIKSKGKYGGTFLTLFHRWADTRSGEQLECAAMLYRHMEGQATRRRDCWIRLATETRKGGWTSFKWIVNLAEVGDAESIACLRSFFDCTALTHDATAPGSTHTSVQDRDAALARCIALSGQKASDYGFSSGSGNFFFPDCFKSDDKQTADEKRTVAFNKWAEWEKSHPEFLKGKPPEKKDDDAPKK